MTHPTRRAVATGLLGASGWPVRALARPGARPGLLEARLAEIERQGGGRLGVAVLDSAQGRVAGHRLDERFPMCSTFKMLAASLVLHRVDQGKEQLERRVRFEAASVVDYSPITKDAAGGPGLTMAEICRAALTYSDNTAGNLMLASFGGPPALTAFARTLGDRVTRLDRIETELNEARPGDPRDTTSPAAMLGNLRKLTTGSALSPASRDQLVTWLKANTTGGARLRAGLPKDWIVGDKTGSGDQATANDIAVAWPPGRGPIFITAYLTQGPESADARSAMLAQVARAVAMQP
jgi:beta-lactamase class A